jgi:hypothetical protein
MSQIERVTPDFTSNIDYLLETLKYVKGPTVKFINGLPQLTRELLAILDLGNDLHAIQMINFALSKKLNTRISQREQTWRKNLSSIGLETFDGASALSFESEEVIESGVELNLEEGVAAALAMIILIGVATLIVSTAKKLPNYEPKWAENYKFKKLTPGELIGLLIDALELEPGNEDLQRLVLGQTHQIQNTQDLFSNLRKKITQ